jgi:hypothetical protein
VASDDDDALTWGPESDDWSPRKADAASPDESSPEGSGLTAPIAALGVVYVVWALAWVIGLAQTPPLTAATPFDAVMYRVGEFLATIASPLWFVGVIWLGGNLTQKARTGILLLGLVVLLPWPLLLPTVLA